jgi:tetratricopeptide (TPR) repeat protein
LQEAKIERNIGNIYNMKGEHDKAEQYWNSAHQKNLSIGNLDQEARHLLNYGIYYYEQGVFDEAIKQYKEASEIFIVLGIRDGEGLALTNLSETNLDICNYQEAYDSLVKAREIFSKLANVDEEAEVIFLLGKLYYLIGDKNAIGEMIKSYKEILVEINERHKNNIRFLELLLKNSYDEKLIKEVRDKYKELNDRGNYSKSNVLLCEACLNNGNYDQAFSAVNEEEFLQICAENSLVKANKEFLIGEISSKNVNLNLPNPFKCYSTAYEIIEDGYITELTWKVLLKLSDIYYERGNFSKITDNIFYANKILYFIADQIKESDLKDKYLKRPDRAAAISRIEFLKKEVS